MLNLTQSIRQARQIAANRDATLFLDRRRTWDQVYDRVARLAGAFIAHGLQPGERIAILALNSDRFLEFYFAAWWAGGAVVPLNTRWTVTENIYALKDSAPSILLVDGHFAGMTPALRDTVSSLQFVFYMGEGESPRGMLDYEELVAETAPAEDLLRQGDDLAGIFYTGGTTGFPKGVMLSHANLYISAIGGLACMHLGENWSYLHSAPMFHLADASMIMMCTMVGGAHAIIEQFNSEETLNAIQRFRVKHAGFVPSMLGMVLQHPQFDQFDLSSLEVINYGASPMPEALLRAVMKRLPGVQLWQGYGQTELSPLATALPPRDHILEGPHTERLRSAGRALPHCEVEVVDENLRPVPAGAVGQIRVRGGNAMLGYWKLPEVTAATIVDGWVLTGDAGYMDNDGYLFLLDRVKDMIVSGGENVYSVEVENALMQHPAVAQCAVIGVPHEIWVEAVHAFVVPKPGSSVTEQEIIDHCHEHIAGYKCPRTVAIRNDPLPLSGAGKVLKRELRKAYEQT